jgi:hypothetical protein
LTDAPNDRRATGTRRTRPAPLPRASSSRVSRLIQIGLALAAVTLVVESLFGARGLSAMMQARRDLGYMAPGEKVFILHDAKPAPTTPAVPNEKK